MTVYADDTSISYSSESLEGINQTLNCELNLLEQWLLGNIISLTVLEIQAVVIGSQPKIKKITDKTTNHPQFFIWYSQVENIDRIRLKMLTQMCLILDNILTGKNILIASLQEVWSNTIANLTKVRIEQQEM